MDALIDLMTAECSAKEIVMAVEEAVESLDRQLQTEDVDDEAEDTHRLSTSQQLARCVRMYTKSGFVRGIRMMSH